MSTLEERVMALGKVFSDVRGAVSDVSEVISTLHGLNPAAVDQCQAQIKDALAKLEDAGKQVEAAIHPPAEAPAPAQPTPAPTVQ